MSEPALDNDPSVEPTQALVKILYAAIGAIVIGSLICSVIGLNQRAWEDGVYWGAEAVREGANSTNRLETAYRLNREAGERVKANKKRLNKYRTLSE